MRIILTIVFLLSACTHGNINQPDVLQSLCGKTYIGNVVSTDPQDEDWRKETLTLGPVKCSSAGYYELPLAVGSNTSRTWFITGEGSAMELRHQHLLDDGSIDPVSNYGGRIRGVPTFEAEKWTMYFPADRKTIEIFMANDLEVSVTNVWSLEIEPEKKLAYQLTRENRNFRAEFDLTNPVQHSF